MTPVIRVISDAREREVAVVALARLRIAVFREWPYLYEGDLDYEARYIAEFLAEPGSMLVTALVDGEVVGAATASPMAGQKAEFQRPFRDRGMDVARLFYFGESVLVPGYRGLGVGHRFFDAREDVARAAGAEAAIFCAVVRPADHVLRPGEARDLHPFWRTRGYAPMEGFTCSLNWKDIDNAQETAHLMQFWSKRL